MCVYTRVSTLMYLKALQSCETLSLFTMDASLTRWLPPPGRQPHQTGVLEADPRNDASKARARLIRPLASSDLRRRAMQAGRLSVALRTPLVAARSLCTKIRPLSDEWARVGLGANRAAPHEKLNRLLFVQCGFGCDRESPPKSTGVS